MAGKEGGNRRPSSKELSAEKLTEVQIFCGLKYSMAVTAGGQPDMEQKLY